MNRAKFYEALRLDPIIFPNGALSQYQVNGIDNLLDVQEKYIPEMHLDKFAYDLATAYHETGATMQPITELGQRSYFNKYEPGTKLGKVLGNTKKGDGYKYRGEGHVQNTGRANALKSSTALNKRFGLHTDFVNFPEQRGNPLYSALCLYYGNDEGWWTGKRLGDFLDGVEETEAEDIREFMEARRVVNGIDKRELIAQYAMSFMRALKKAGYGPKLPTRVEVHVPKPKLDLVEQIAPQIPQPETSWFKLIFNLIFRR